MTLVRTTVLLLLGALAACAAPGESATVIEAGPDLISLRAPATDEADMEGMAARHCAQFDRRAALRFYRREGPRGDQLYALYQCL